MRSGISAAHGRHHVAHTFTTTTLPAIASGVHAVPAVSIMVILGRQRGASSVQDASALRTPTPTPDLPPRNSISTNATMPATRKAAMMPALFTSAEPQERG